MSDEAEKVFDEERHPSGRLSKEDIKDLAMIMFDIFTESMIHGIPTSAVAEGGSTMKSHFRPTDVGFFDPKLDESYDAGDVI